MVGVVDSAGPVKPVASGYETERAETSPDLVDGTGISRGQPRPKFDAVTPRPSFLFSPSSVPHPQCPSHWWVPGPGNRRPRPILSRYRGPSRAAGDRLWLRVVPSCRLAHWQDTPYGQGRSPRRRTFLSGPMSFPIIHATVDLQK